MKVIIPSKGRPNSATLALLKREGIPENTFFCVVRESEYEQYLPSVENSNVNLIKIKDDDKLDDATTRNAGMYYIINNFPDEKYIVFIDDDLKKVSTKIGEFKSKNCLDACTSLVNILINVQKKYPTTWLMSAKQPGPFMKEGTVFMNSGTPWVCMCAVDIDKKPEAAFLSTKEFGPQEITVPLMSVSTGSWYASTSCVIIYLDSSTVGGISTIINTESREEREKMYYEILQRTFPRYTSIRKSRTLGIQITRCNFNNLKKDFEYPTEEIEVNL